MNYTMHATSSNKRNNRFIDIILFLNFTIFLPILSSIPLYIRLIQLLSIILAVISVNHNKKEKNYYFISVKKYIYLYIVLLISIILSIISNGEEILVGIGSHLLLFLYSISVIKLISLLNNKDKILKYTSIIFITNSLFFVYLTISNNTFNSIELNNLDLSSLTLVKRNKSIFIENGYNIHSELFIISLLYFISLDYITRNKKTLYYCTTIMAYVVLFSFSFTMIIIFLALIFIIVYNKNKVVINIDKKLIITIISFISIITITLISLQNNEYIQNLFSGRIALWSIASFHIMQNPFFGISYNEFYESLNNLQRNSILNTSFSEVVSGGDLSSGGAHQMLLNWFMHYGCISGILYIIYIIRTSQFINSIKSIEHKYISLPFFLVLFRGISESGMIIGDAKGLGEILIAIYIGYCITLIKKKSI